MAILGRTSRRRASRPMISFHTWRQSIIAGRWRMPIWRRLTSRGLLLRPQERARFHAQADGRLGAQVRSRRGPGEQGSPPRTAAATSQPERIRTFGSGSGAAARQSRGTALLLRVSTGQRSEILKSRRPRAPRAGTIWRLRGCDGSLYFPKTKNGVPHSIPLPRHGHRRALTP